MRHMDDDGGWVSIEEFENRTMSLHATTATSPGPGVGSGLLHEKRCEHHQPGVGGVRPTPPASAGRQQAPSSFQTPDEPPGTSPWVHHLAVHW